MNKQNLILAVLQKLESELALLKEATLATYDAATNEESQPENQYDTRALEASYLAGAQAKRLAEIEAQIFLYRSTSLRHFTSMDEIDLTALVELESGGQKSIIFLMAKGGGMKLNFEGKIVQTLTPEAPLGEALMTLQVDDVAVVEDKIGAKEYRILQIW